MRSCETRRRGLQRGLVSMDEANEFARGCGSSVVEALVRFGAMEATRWRGLEIGYGSLCRRPEIIVATLAPSSDTRSASAPHGVIAGTLGIIRNT